MNMQGAVPQAGHAGSISTGFKYTEKEITLDETYAQKPARKDLKTSAPFFMRHPATIAAE